MRIYDLSDLFAVAPAYYARQSADLDGDQLIFDRAQGVMGGGMGGMGCGRRAPAGGKGMPDRPRW